MLPPPPRWTVWAFSILAWAALLLLLGMMAPALLPDMPWLRNAVGLTYYYGMIYVVAPGLLAVGLFAIAVRLWRYFRGYP